jgi:4'-phosphopantetheinyl transferase
MILYLYYNENKVESRTRSGMSERLVRKALSDYCRRRLPGISAESLAAIDIAREEKGKPYFQGLPADRSGRIPQVHFSVSHSGNWWGCLMADEPVGFDIEVCRDRVSHEKIAGRFFTEEESDLILSGGPDVFFEVWVRKEAYLKYLGTGLAGGLDSFTVAENGRILEHRGYSGYGIGSRGLRRLAPVVGYRLSVVGCRSSEERRPLGRAGRWRMASCVLAP